ncbi:MAG: DEAD/DEAH box helicase family protein [Truepera sp.]|nr:DEAD/DEAH box helicase family protein [Truepera sp.]
MPGYTIFHARLFAEELTQRFASSDFERLAGTLVDAQVDLNPHQVDAALFAFHSPLSKGAILADEVGLGKTIEAGLVIAQKWAERKRRVLCVTPANLRKQWFQELSEKFFLPCEILESRFYNAAIKQGNFEPLMSERIVICSYQFARAKATDIARIKWDLVVMDEAHRLRNVYKPGNVIANVLKKALDQAPKILLTATPLQNNLQELYGLVSIIDDRTFGDLGSFRAQFGNLDDPQAFNILRERLRPVCHRTLRRQVQAYIKYTRRQPLTQDFTPSDAETELYDLVSEYLRRESLHGLPSSQRNLITLVMRKLLASSSFAVAGALENIGKRLRKQLEGELGDRLGEDYEALDATAEEWGEEPDDRPLSEADKAAIAAEVADLERYFTLASSITDNAKGQALLAALERAFEAAERLGAERKAIIFTESRRTQAYLLRLLEPRYSGKVVLFNGSNADPGSKRILRGWQERHQGTDRITGSASADIRSALVDEFRERAEIMIATEAGSEGINLQFCSLVINYDLPWNPQRIEQRIGRCHRYGQKHDVVVVNFVNRANQADQRVFELLEQKFRLFDGVFGSSDEVLGAIESGVDFERRIAEIYQRCRTPEQIQAAFDALQQELSLEIQDSMSQTRKKLLENFDEEVNQRLKTSEEQSKSALNRFERLLMDLTRHELDGAAVFDDKGFELLHNPTPLEIPLGRYELPRYHPEAHFYRLLDNLAQYLIQQARERPLGVSELEFDYTAYPAKITLLENLRGQSGWLRLSKFSVSALQQTEDYLLAVAVTDGGEPLLEETPRDLFKLPAKLRAEVPQAPPEMLETLTQARCEAIQATINQRNADFFEQEATRLDTWADDMKVGLDREIKELDRQIKEARRAASLAQSLQEKLEGQKQIKALEAARNARRRSLFDAQDEIDRKRGDLIEEIEAQLQQKQSLEPVFTIRWGVV